MAKTNSYKSQYAKESAYIRKRIKALESKVPLSPVVERYRDEFPAIKDFAIPPTERDYQAALKEIRKVKESGVLSLRWQRRSYNSFIKRMNDQGYDFVNEENARELLEFLDDAQARNLTSIFGYQQITLAIHKAIRKGLTKEEIIQNMDYFKQFTDPEKRKAAPSRIVFKKDRKSSSDYIRKRIRQANRSGNI